MHDKDIDALFRGKLEDLEMMPSANVWSNISAELDAGKKRRLVPVWSIAASVALLIGAGLFLMRGNKDDNTQQGQQIAHVEGKRPVTAEASVESARPQVVEAPAAQPVTAAPEKYIAAAKPVKATAKKQVTGTVAKPQEIIANTPAAKPAQEQQPVLAAIEKPASAVTKPVVPDAQDVTLAPASMTSEVETTPVKVMASTMLPTEIKAKPKKHGVHTLGDLINNVVGSIDKRKDKLIEFTDSDDDQANVTGINLGIFKLKRASK